MPTDTKSKDSATKTTPKAPTTSPPKTTPKTTPKAPTTSPPKTTPKTTPKAPTASPPKTTPKTTGKKSGTGPSVPVFSVIGEKKGNVSLPEAFSTPVRLDLVHRVVVAAEANKRQPYAPSPVAGMQHSVEWPGKGRGMARTPRLNHGGGRGAEAPNTVGGSRAHPPKLEKDYSIKVNKKERHLARNSAIAATANAEIVAARGHLFDDKVELPVIVEDAAENIASTSEAISLLKKIGLDEDLVRSKEGKHIRAGRGKMRGRKYRQPRSVLFVISPEEGVSVTNLALGFRNIPGVEVVSLRSLGTKHLAPGGDVGRLTVYTERAIEAMRMW